MANEIVVLLRHGLANRLRTIVGFTYVGETLDVPVTFYWDTSDAECNGLFSDLFEPYHIRIYEFRPSNVKFTFVGQDTIPMILKKYNIQGDISKIENKYYKMFHVKPHIMNAVNWFFEQNNGLRAKNSKLYHNFASMHIRRTDHSDLAKRFNSYTADDEFDLYSDKCRSNGKSVFLATDSLEVQKKYDWCITHKHITPTKKLRQTTLVDAMIDVLIASKCIQFKGSGFSSYSRLIEIYRDL